MLLYHHMSPEQTCALCAGRLCARTAPRRGPPCRLVHEEGRLSQDACVQASLKPDGGRKQNACYRPLTMSQGGLHASHPRHT
jgi:hypothetical protein